MALIKLNTNPLQSQLESFGRFWTPLFAAILAYSLWSTGGFVGCLIVLIVAVVVSAVGWYRARWLKFPFVVAMLLTYPIGVVVGVLLIGIVYYFCVCPIGLLLRLVGKDLLHQKWIPELDSYWVIRKQDKAAERYFRQF